MGHPNFRNILQKNKRKYSFWARKFGLENLKLFL